LNGHCHLRPILVLVLLQGYVHAQIFPFRAGETMGITAMDVKLGSIVAGSAATLLSVTADPSIGGGDIFDIYLQNSSLGISLILPNGVEVNSTNASSLGFDYAAYQVPSTSQLQEIVAARAGAHVLITMAPSQPAGIYTVKVNAAAVTSASAVEIAYLSSSSVRAGVRPDSPSYRVGDLVILTGVLLNEVAPVIGATVTATTWTSVPLPQASVTNYRLVSQRALDNGTEYEYAADLVTGGAAGKGVQAVSTSLSNTVSVVQGELNFGDISAAGTTSSVNTVIVRVSPAAAFNPSLISWDIRSTTPGTTVNLQDSGSFDYATGDGLYTGTFTASAAGEYIVVMRATGAAGSVPFSRVATTRLLVTEPRAAFVANSFTDSAQTNGAGLISQLTVSANAGIQVAGTYMFSVDLKASNGEVVQATTTASLSLGTQAVSVVFQSSDLVLLGVGGPYQRLGVTLTRISGTETSVVAYQDDAGPTAAYSLSSFDQGQLHFTGTNSATGVITTGGSTFDLLRVQIGVFNSAGDCQWQASLTDPSGTKIDQVFHLDTLAAGYNNLILDFSGPNIARNGQNGPYRITGVDIICGTSELTSDLLFSTQPILASQFKNTPADFTLTSSVSAISVNTLSGAIVNFAANPLAGFSQTVSFSVAGLPSGVTGQFFWPQSPVPATSTLQLTTGFSVPAGTYPLTITATGGGLTRTIPLSMTVVHVPTTVQLSGPFDYRAGQTGQYSATVNGLPSTAMTWSLDPPADRGVISPIGVYTAPSPVARVLSVSVIATSTDDPTASGSISVTLHPPSVVTINPVAAILYGGQEQDFTVIETNGFGAGPAFSISQNAPGTFFTGSGQYFAPSTISSTQTLTVTATSLIDPSKSAAATITLQPGPAPARVAAPVFSPISGAYSSAQTVSIGTTTAGASIRYTTDGSLPTQSVGTLYSGPIAVGSSTTLKAIAYAAGMADSPTISAPYTINAPVAAPVFSPGAGTYTSSQTVSLSTTTLGASIRYTTDGSTPSATVGTVYGGPVTVGSTTTITAIAYASGMTNSAVVSAAYTITPQVAAPSFSPAAGTYSSAQTVTISTATSGASIRYTTDGSAPTLSVGTLYTVAITVGSATTIKAIAYASGMTDSAVSSANYTINLPAAAPTFSPAAGTYSSTQTVTISTSTSGASIRYTTDGSTPTSSVGTLYSSPVSVSSTVTIKAIAYATGMTDSAVSSAVYTINLPVTAPAFSPAAGTYSSAQTVTISTSTSGASIRYTTDGSTPTSSVGTLYSAPIGVSSTVTIRAIAFATGMTDSSVNSATYTINLAIPPATDVSSQVSVTGSGLLFNRIAGTYNGTVTITNTSQQIIVAPVQALFQINTAGVSLANATGVSNGRQFITASGSALAPGQAVTFQVRFNNPSNAVLDYSVNTYSGTL
jgi:hypothetical protein